MKMQTTNQLTKKQQNFEILSDIPIKFFVFLEEKKRKILIKL